MSDTDPMPPGFDGCARPCRAARVHTFEWGRCEHAPESARPQPSLTVGRHVTMSDGHPSLVLESVPVPELAARVEAALRSVSVMLGPNSLAILQAGGRLPLTDGEYAAMALAVAVDLTEGTA